MLLLDTQAALWWLAGDDRLSTDARHAIRESPVVATISVASIWEIEIKRAKGKYNGPILLDQAREGGFAIIDITAEHAVAAAQLPPHHGDPFDRMIVAQAMVERRTLVTSDAALSAYDVPIVW